MNLVTSSLRNWASLALCLIVAACGGSENSSRRAEDDHSGHNHAGNAEHASANVNEQATAGIDWCVEHSVPETKCTKCHPELIEAFKSSGDWCGGHDIPESQCRLCNSGLTFSEESAYLATLIEAHSKDLSISLYRRSNASICATDSALIQFASLSTAERAGIECQTVRSSVIDATIDAPATIAFDEAEESVVTSTVSAVVTRWMASPGDNVRAGDVLAIASSPEIGDLKSALMSTIAAARLEHDELARRQELLDRSLISKSEYDRQVVVTEQADAELVRSKALLRSAGLSSEDIEEVAKGQNVTSQFALRAQSNGVVVDRKAKLGELLPPGSAFALVANPNALWIEGRLTENNLHMVNVGQRVTFSSDGQGLNRVAGEVVWVSKFLDPETNTGTVRARVLSSPEALHAGELGRVEIHEQSNQDIVLVPRDAVQWEGCCNVVFVREAIDRYRPRKVQLRDGMGEMFQVLSGVKAGEDVVVEGSFLLKTELKKSSIGAGCCEVEPIG